MKTPHHRTPPLLAILLLPVLLVGAAADEKPPSLDGLDVEARLVLPEPAAPPQPAPAPPDIGTETVVPAAGADVRALLRERRIEPDGDALSAVYVLNPDLRSIGSLAAGRPLVLPVVRNAEALPEGALVRLSLASRVKRDLQAATRALDPLFHRVQQLPAGRLGDDDETEEIVGALDEVLGYLGQVNELLEKDRLPVSPETLSQALPGARAVRDALERTLRAGRLGPEDRGTIVGVWEDMNLKARSFDEARGADPARWRDVEVTVTVVRGADGSPAAGLRVFYVQEALARRPDAAQSFPGASPRVSKRLLEGDYLFWAAEPGGAKPATDRLRQEVRRSGGGVEVRLVIPPKRGSSIYSKQP